MNSMASSIATQPQQAMGLEANGSKFQAQDEDPFKSTPQSQHPHPHRFSSFDTQLFALNHPSSSPTQAKRALEAHMAETERRLNETSTLGTALLQQKKHISDRLREVETHQGDGEIGPELRQKLVDIEKEYNEVGRASARTFLGPKLDNAASGVHSPFALDGKRPASPSKFSSEAVDSPSKLNVPRKQRNQPSNQVGNIEFAVEINTSLIAQVRQLQSVITERDDALKAAALENSRWEVEAEGFSQRLKSLDESEQRYKDENWNLETQIQEMNAAAKEATTREQKLQQLLAIATSEKSGAQRDLDDLRQNHGKLMEDFAMVRKNHDSELASLRKGANLGESEKGALQRKVDELTSQNQELAKAVAGRFRDETSEQEKDIGSGLDDPPTDRSETEHSPPPSPTKGVPRHAMLESETLKSSLHHAHRMIQNLKSNIHREKNEKQELKRMLQEARDELDVRRRELGGPAHENKRGKSKSQQDFTKKPIRPNMLGAGRESKTDVTVDDAEWEEHNGERTPRQANGAKFKWANNESLYGQGTDMSDAYQTANETEDAFETANERDTTENEGRSSTKGESSDELTETEESLIRAGTVRAVRPSPLTLGKARDRASFRSTASTSGDEEEQSLRTPVQNQPQRYRLKIGRGSRKSRIGSEPLEGSNPSSAKNSPASVLSGGAQPGQSLFAELGDLNGGDSGEEADGTPSRRSSSHHSTPSLSRSLSRQRSTQSLKRRHSSSRSIPGTKPFTTLQGSEEPPIPKLPLVDSGMMTDPWEPTQTSIWHPESSSVPTSTGEDANSTTNPTPESKHRIVQATSGSSPDMALDKSVPPRTAWDQPLGILSSIIPTFGSASQPNPFLDNSTASHDIEEPESTKEPLSNMYSLPKQPQNIEQQRGMMSPFQSQTMADAPGPTKHTAPALSISSIYSLETAPAQIPTQSIQPPPLAKSNSAQFGASPVPKTESKAPNTERILDSTFGPSKPSIAPPQITEDESSRYSFNLPIVTSRGLKTPFTEIPSNTVQTYKPRGQDLEDYAAMPLDVADQSSQTVLSSEQIESMLRQKEKVALVNGHKTAVISSMKPLSEIGAVSPTLTSHRMSESIDNNKGKMAEQIDRELASFKVPKRPLSSASIRSQTSTYPPLPPNHQQAIAAAAQKAPPVEVPTGLMGPPLAPASSYRQNVTRPRTPSRPRTPNQQSLQSPASKIANTPRARHSTSRSQVSRRSSVSSFASELDERFNIRLEGMPGPYGFENGTDPRMIQAITQTMIGEFLWKYTRKAGRGEMSSNRHRRFFWVHPYTRTLYWSDKDPATAGRAELKAKSVAIESVQVVLDDNPMPPGLHRKSLIIRTPGRSVKLTATTGQRHETWFNALSYLLVRTGSEAPGETVEGSNIATEDIEEFNPSYSRRASRTAGSRISLASFKSNASQRSLTPRAHSRLSTRQPTGASIATTPNAQSPDINSHQSVQHPRHQASLSRRLSEYWKPSSSVRESVSSRISRSVPPVQDEIDTEENKSRNSAEDARAVIEQQEKDADHLENVRACCDGRHDVGSLSKSGRHHSYHGPSSGGQSNGKSVAK